MTEQPNFSILKTADIPQGEFASMCGVSRVTVNLWINGKVSPNRFLRDKVDDLLDRIERAVNNKMLPLPGHIRYGKNHLGAVTKAITPAT